MLKFTPPTHPDFPDLTKTIEKIKVLAEEIDHAIGKAKSRAKCLEIQTRIELAFGKKALTISLVEAHRIFLKEGVLKKRLHNGGIVDRRFILFNDMMICCPVSSENFTSIRPYYLESMTVKDIMSSNYHGFQILSYGESFTVQTNNIKEKNEWMNALNDATRAYAKNFPKLHKETAPIWMLDDAAPQCMRCKNPFTVISRRHHCRSCGDVVCGDCSQYKAIVPGVNREREVRVCNSCKKELSKNQK